MKKLYFIFIIALFLQLTARAELRSGHFFKSLQKENLTEQKAVECFDQWFELPQETEWRKVSERTDKMGMTRIEYRQYVSGVEVEHSQVLLHMKDGRVQTANGTVMEALSMPAKLRRGSVVYKNGTPTDLLGRQLYLVITKEGYRYATKALSVDGSEWIYTDADTGEVLKRVPTRHSLTVDPVKVTGSTIYSGDVEMDASYDRKSKSYLLWDQQRGIHTMIGATIPSLVQMINEHTLTENLPEVAATLPVPEYMMTTEMWYEWLNTTEPTIDLSTVNLLNFASRNAVYASSTKSIFDSYVLNTITIDKLASTDDKGKLTEIVPTEDNPLVLLTEIYYPGTDGIIEQVKKTITCFPFTLDLKKYNDEIPADGVNIEFKAIVENETTEEVGDSTVINLTYLNLKPNTSGRRAWTNNNVRATATFEKGPWSAVDIHWGMQQTYDFYLNTFDRNSYDDNAAPILNLFYLPCNFGRKGYYVTTPMNNAMADPSGPYMVYGMGNREGGTGGMYPAVELSVMAHEFTHLVTFSTANLEYLGESGALNESFSDLLGVSVKKYVQGDDATWTIGEGMMEYASNLRSMSFPKTSMDGKDPCPDTYQGEFWWDTESELDYGGVHTNSGVQNKWYYLLTDGDSGTNDNGYSYQVDGIGIEKSQQIAYRTLTEYATQESQYADIRLASLQATKDLFGENSDEVKTVDEAWSAVGVGGTQTAINEVESRQMTKANGAIYNLSGQMVNGSPRLQSLPLGAQAQAEGAKASEKLPAGIYIVGGKKVAIK